MNTRQAAAKSRSKSEASMGTRSDQRSAISAGTGSRDQRSETGSTGGTSMTEAGDSDIRAQLKKIASGQNTIMNKIRENNDDLKTMIATEVSKVRDDIFLEMSQITRRLDILESRSPVATNTREPFSPDVTVVIANLALVSASETEAALMDKINHVLAEGLALPGIEPVAVTRRAARGRGPGLVLLELNDVGDKITVLKAKQSLRNKPEYKNLYLSSAEGHTDRLMRLNFNTLLNHLNLTREFRFTGSGRLVPRDDSHCSHGDSDRHATTQEATGHDATTSRPVQADA